MDPNLFTLNEVAAFLRLTEEQIMNLVWTKRIPFVELEGKHLFPKDKIETWIENNLLSAADIDEGTLPDTLLQVPLTNFIPRGGIFFTLGKKPKDAILSHLVTLSQRFGCISDPEGFLDALKEREQMVSTAIEGGIAFLHTRRRIPKNILRPFLLVGVSHDGLQWGAPDGKPTHVLVLMGLRHDTLHLKILSQLARMTRAGLVKKLMEAGEEDKAVKVLLALEKKCPRT
jgi:mannitol/fructose-specific phosphotransferase system IIA component (Ntr-type)